MNPPIPPVAPILKMEGITKQYFGNVVLKGVDLDVLPGEIVCLVGENGAGKSTLMNILFGMPVIAQTGGFGGKVVVADREVRFANPLDAMNAGVGMVHQEFMLLDGFTITENIKLNREITRPGPLTGLYDKLSVLDRDTMRKEAVVALSKVGLDLDPDTLAGHLPVGHKQFVEIAREVDKTSTRLVVFDEPTAVLTESEAQTLLATMKRLAASGIGILFITHRLDEVVEVASRVVVLRDGETVAKLSKGEFSIAKIAALMVGRTLEKVELPARKSPVTDQDLILSLKDVHVEMPGEAVRGLSLDVRRGEILGIGGLAGFGKVGIANGVLGLYPRRGTIIKDGQPIPVGDPAAVLARRMAFVSEDRRGVGLLLDESIALNMGLTALQVVNRFRTRRFGIEVSDDQALDAYARDRIDGLAIKCTGPDQPVRRLSGGNQQKVCISRALALEPDLLFVSEPTRGVDVGAKKLILDTLVKLNREQGMTIVMTSSELAELRQVCDRIVIVCQGRVSRILAPEDSDAEFGMAMAGVTATVAVGGLS